MLALDLYSGGGGACLGMQAAGFHVIGIDIKYHKNYPSDQIVADLSQGLPVDITQFSLAWASPPCQRFSSGSRACINPDKWKEHPDLIDPTRELLKDHPFSVIENVPQAPLKASLILNGPSVGLNWIQRKRHFEISFLIWQPELPRVPGIRFSILKSRSATNPRDKELREDLGLPSTIPKDVAKVFMGIPLNQKMTDAEIGESVCPPIAEFIAREARRQLEMY